MSSPWVVGRRAVASVPVRVADVGGWTDTWFGSPGRVCSLAVGPGVEVAAEVVARAGGEAPVRLVAPAIGLDAPCGPRPTADGTARCRWSTRCSPTPWPT
ncbi:MAG: hypothetical protein KF703_11045, partial [Actinobacteria bacterium]|nr:hypothetical protein [Actinomycetota bacterium]